MAMRLDPQALYIPDLPWFFHADTVDDLSDDEFESVANFVRIPFKFNRFATFFSARCTNSPFDTFAKFLLNLRPDGRVLESDELRQLGLSFFRLLIGFRTRPAALPSRRFVHFVSRKVLSDLASYGLWTIYSAIFVALRAQDMTDGLRAPSISVPFDAPDVAAEVISVFGFDSILWVYTTDADTHFRSLSGTDEIANAREAADVVCRRVSDSRYATERDFASLLTFLELCFGKRAFRDLSSALSPGEWCPFSYVSAWRLRFAHVPPARPVIPDPAPVVPDRWGLPDHVVLVKVGTSLTRSQQSAAPRPRPISIEKPAASRLIISTHGPR
jgi:hypothetical protein